VFCKNFLLELIFFSILFKHCMIRFKNDKFFSKTKYYYCREVLSF
jgi:hypothetical protein